MEPTEEQITAAKAILSALEETPLVAVSGKMGSGKYKTIKTMIKLYQTRYPDRTVQFCSLSSRSAPIIKDRYGIESTQYHYLLEVYYDDNGQMQFGRTLQNPIDADLFIIQDSILFAESAFLDPMINALKPNCRVIVIDDIEYGGRNKFLKENPQNLYLYKGVYVDENGCLTEKTWGPEVPLFPSL